ncbi:MAG: hypothetical protein AAB458_00865 [Patescibacteria group bacterium]
MKKSAFILSLIVPSLAFAAPANLTELINDAIGLINPLIVLASALAVLAFVWGIVKYIASAGDGKAKDDGRKIMVYGIIGLFVLFSFWGIVQFIKTDIFG